MRPQAACGMRCRNCGTEQTLQELARGGGHGVPPRARWAMLTSTAFHIHASLNLVLRSALLCASRRTATSETEPAAILRDGPPQVGCSRLAYLMCRSRVNPRSVRLLRMRAVGRWKVRWTVTILQGAAGPTDFHLVKGRGHGA